MASLQARHSRSCALGKPWTPFDKVEGCTCERGPLWHVVIREGKTLKRERVGRNKREAKRALDKINGQVAEGAFVAIANRKFSDHADAWVTGLEIKETTRSSYKGTVKLAKDAFGNRNVRQVLPSDIREFSRTTKENGASDSTRARHLRVLHACFAAAVVDHCAAINPVSELKKSDRPKPTKKEAPFFTNDEIPRLFAKLPEFVGDVPNVYRALFMTALKSGMRQGELLALKWGDVDMTGGVIHVRRSITGGHLSTPKNRKKREVYIGADLVEYLGWWWGVSDKPEDEALVFPGSTGETLWPMTILRRVLYPAMQATVDADGGKTDVIPREDASGAKRTFHSFRHTYAKRAIESNTPILWLSRQLGHSSLAVTSEVYGHVESSERERQAQELVGVFGV